MGLNEIGMTCSGSAWSAVEMFFAQIAAVLNQYSWSHTFLPGKEIVQQPTAPLHPRRGSLAKLVHQKQGAPCWVAQSSAALSQVALKEETISTAK